MAATILAGTKDGLYTVADETKKSLAGHEVTALAKEDDGWMAILDGREVWRSGLNGDWESVATLDGLKANCILPTASGTLVGTSEAHVYSLRNENLELVETFDQAPERETWFTPWGGPPDVRSLTADAAGTVFANVHVGGVVRSADAAGSWQPTIDIKADVHQIVADHGSGAVLAASAKGLVVSRDGGEAWDYQTDGLHGNYLRAVAAVDGTVFITASTAHNSNRAAVYKRALDSSGPFQRCEAALPEWFPSNIDTYCLAADSSTVAFGTSQGQVFVSHDRGESWSLLVEDLPAVLCVALP